MIPAPGPRVDLTPHSPSVTVSVAHVKLLSFVFVEKRFKATQACCRPACMYIEHVRMSYTVVVCCLLNVPAACYCISGTDLLRQFYALPHRDISCISNSSRSQYTDTRPTSPSADLITPGLWQANVRRAIVQGCWYDHTRNNPHALAGVEPWIFRSRDGRLNHSASEVMCHVQVPANDVNSLLSQVVFTKT